MDDELLTLEAELKRLSPLPPTPGLAAQIAAELRPRRRAAGAAAWFWGIALPAAAAVAVLIAKPWRWTERVPLATPATAEARPAEAVFKPVAVENVLYSAQDEGIITLGDGTAARRERLRYLDTIIWRNPHTNASLTWTLPREEVRVIPVSLQ